MAVGVRPAMRERLRPTGAAIGPVVALALILLVGATLVMVLTRGLTCYYDEWSFVLDRGGMTVDTFLQSHNEHLSVLPIAVYKVMLQVFGMDDYWAFRLMIAAVDAVLATLVYLYARPRIGAWTALAPAAILALLGSGWENMLWPFQIGMSASLGCGIGALLMLDRVSRLGDALATFLLAVGLAASSVGLPVAAGVLVELTLRRELRPRSWIALGPLLLYGLWWTGFHVSTFKSENLPDVPAFAADMASSAIGATFGWGLETGRVVLVLAMVGGGLAALRGGQRISPRLGGIVAIAGAFWIATAITRADTHLPGGSRYVHVGAILVLVAIVELARGRRIGHAPAALLGAAAVMSIVGNLLAYEDGRRHLKLFSDEVRLVLAALEIADAEAPKQVVAVEPFYAPVIRSRNYLAAVAALARRPGSTSAISARSPRPSGRTSTTPLSTCCRCDCARRPRRSSPASRRSSSSRTACGRSDRDPAACGSCARVATARR